MADWRDDLGKLKAYDVSSVLTPKEPKVEKGAVSRGFETALRQIPQTAGGATALVGDMFNMPKVKDFGLSIYQGQEEKIKELSNESDSFSNVLDGNGSIGEFIKYGAGYVGGQALTAIGTGGVGALIGKQLVQRGISKKAAAEIGSKAADDIAKAAIKKGAKVGGVTAMGGSNVIQEVGSIYPEAIAQAEKEGRELTNADRARVIGSGIAAAGVDTVAQAAGIGKVLKGSNAPTLAGRAVREMPLAMGREGITEGIQTGFERFGAGKELTGDDAKREYIDSMALGALGGSMAGAAASIRAQKQPEVGPLSGASNAGIESEAMDFEQGAAKAMEIAPDVLKGNVVAAPDPAVAALDLGVKVNAAKEFFRNPESKKLLSDADRGQLLGHISIAENPSIEPRMREHSAKAMVEIVGQYMAGMQSPTLLPVAPEIKASMAPVVEPVAQVKPVAIKPVNQVMASALPEIDDGAILDKMSKAADQDIKDQKVWGEPKGDKPTLAVGKVVASESEPVMQNRDRSRPASIEQMNKIANDPDYDRLGTGKSPNDAAPMISVKGNAEKIAASDIGKSDRVTMGDGSKIAVKYAVVEADDVLASHSVDGQENKSYYGDVKNGTLRALNNGRTAALQASYDRGTAKKYKDALIADAAMHGVSREAIEGKKKPILVRVYDDVENDRPDIGAISNPISNLGFAASESAQNDAKILDVIDFEPGENGEIDTPNNADALNRFATAIKAQGGDTANTKDRNGRFSSAFVDRFKNAVFAKAYKDRALVEIAADVADPDLKNVMHALTHAAPSFAKIDDAGDLEIRPQLVDAVGKIRDARARGLRYDEYAAQTDMWGQDDFTEQLARFMWANIRAPKRLGEGLKTLAKFIDEEISSRQTVDIFGDDPANLSQVTERVNNFLEAEFGDIGKIEQETKAYAEKREVSARTDNEGRQPTKEQRTAFKTSDKVTKPLGPDEYVNALVAREQMPLFIQAGDQLQLAIPSIIRKLAFRKDANKATKQDATEVLEDLAGWIKKGSVLASIAADQIKSAGAFDLIGSQIRSAKDLATAAQVLRDSRFETLRYIFVKDGKVIGHTAVSSRLPSVTNSWPGASGEKRKAFFGDLGTMAQKSDGYYLLHNHPSGDPTPSRADVTMTIEQAQRVPGLLGHVIIDTNRYAEIDKRGAQVIVEEDFSAKETDRPGILLRKILSKTDLAKIGSELKKPGYVTLIAANSELKVNAAMEIPERLLTKENTRRFRNLISDFGLEYGSGAGVFLAGVETDLNQFSQLIADGFLVDAVNTSGLSLVSSGAQRGNASQLGRKNTFAKLVMQRFISPDLDVQALSTLTGLSENDVSGIVSAKVKDYATADMFSQEETATLGNKSPDLFSEPIKSEPAKQDVQVVTAAANIEPTAESAKQPDLPQQEKAETEVKPVAPVDSKLPLFTRHQEVSRSLRQGTVSVADYKATFESLTSNPEPFKAELASMTKEELLKGGGSYFYMRYKNDAKPEIVKQRYLLALDQYSLGKSYGPSSFSMSEIVKADEIRLEALKKLVAGQTQEDLSTAADEIAKEREEVDALRVAREKSLADPKTLIEYREYIANQMEGGKTDLEARLSLSVDKRAGFDQMSAEAFRSSRSAAFVSHIAEVKTASQTVNASIINTKHTQKGHDLFVVQLGERVAREDYLTLNASAKKLGGYYSAFRGRGAVPGFTFTDKAQAEAFVSLAGGDAAQAKEAVAIARDVFEDNKSQSSVDRLKAMAEKLDEQAEESLSIERKSNTARRARFAASAEMAANGDKAMASTMKNLAAAIESGKAKLLNLVRTKTQVQMLYQMVRTAHYEEGRAKKWDYSTQEKSRPTIETADFVKFPRYTAYRSDLAAIARQLSEVDGTKMFGQSLLKVADDVSKAYLDFVKDNLGQVMKFSRSDGGLTMFGTKAVADAAIARSGYKGKAISYQVKRGQHTVIFSPSEAISRGVWEGDGDKQITIDSRSGANLVESIGKANRRGARVSVPYSFESTYDQRKRLAAIGIEQPAELRGAIREFLSLKAEVAPVDKIKEMERAMAGRRNDGLDFFPTPESVADQMIEAAGIEPGMAVLEPSAGMGHIAERIRETGVEPDVSEISEDRRELLDAKGFRLIERNFLDIKPRDVYTYGDVFRAPNGTEGVMLGNLRGSWARVRLIDKDGNESYQDRESLTPVETRGSDSGYDRIIMNPPFSDGRDIDHVKHAYELLKKGGKVVALMGESAFTNQNKKAQAFRDWLNSVGGTEEKLPPGSFNDPSLPVNTAANARMVVIEKSADGEVQSNVDEYESKPETINVGGIKRSRTNSNGKPIASTDEGIRNFWKWFGDSKVIDDQGRPMVVYHGTNKDFAVFKESWNALFFAFDKEAAETLSDGKNSFIKKFYIKSQRPFDSSVKAHVRQVTAAIFKGKGKTLDFDVAVGENTSRLDFAKKIADQYENYYVVEHGYTQDAIKEVGFDSFYVTEYGLKSIAIYSPANVKSAQDNNGNFNSNSDSTVESLITEYVVNSAPTKVSNKLTEIFETKTTFNRWWDRTVGTQFHKAWKSPEFKAVYDKGQQYLADVSRFATEAADQALTLLPRMDSFSDLKRKPLSEKENKALAAPIFEGTLKYFRDSNGQVQEASEETTGGIVWTDAELKSRYKLDDNMIKLYREFLAATNNSLDTLAKTDMLRYAGDFGLEVAEKVMNAADAGQAAVYLTNHLQKLRVSTERENWLTLTNMETVITEKAEHIEGMKEKGYAPLMRFGKYSVYVTKDDKQVYFGLFENERDANKMRKQMEALDPDSTVKQGVLSEEAYKLFSGVSPDTLEMFAESAGIEKNEIFQEYLQLAKSNRSAMKRLINRKGVDGFDVDVTRILSSFVTSNARSSSGNLHLGELKKAASGDQWKGKGDAQDEAVKLVDYVQNPKEEAQALRGLLFVQFLGGSVASALVNMTQPLTMTLPYLSQFGGATKAASSLTSAMGQAAKPKTIKDADLKAAFERGTKEGIVSPQEIHQLQAEASRSVGSNIWARRGLFVWGSMFSLAEQFNRRVTFIAAYNTAKAQGIPNAYEFAKNAIAETQGVYNRGNRPNWARGAVGATLFTFKQYSIGYLEFLKRLPPKQRVLALGILMLSAGVQGLPFSDDLDDLIDSLAQHLGYSWNSKEKKTQFLSAILGKTGGEFMMRGFSSLPGVPIDVAGRMGMSNLLPGTGLLLKSKQNKESEVFEALGPAGGLFQNALKGEFAPVAIKNLSKGLDMYQTGIYKDTKGRKVMDVDGFDALMKGIGFQPAEVAQESRKIQLANQNIQLAKTVEAEIADKMAQSIIEGDPSKRVKANEELREWNETNPEARIRIESSQIARRVKELKSTREERFLKRTPKELRAQMAEAL